MGRRAVPELPATETTESEDVPVFGSEEEANIAAENHLRPARYAVVEGGTPLAPAPVASPMQATPSKAPVVARAKRYRVVGLERGGTNYIDRSGRMARMVPNKVLDERYFDIAFLKAQGFNLVEVGENDRQIGAVGS